MLKTFKLAAIAALLLAANQGLAQANAEMMDTGIGKHATLFYAVLDTQHNTLTYSMAGHLPVPLIIAEGEARYLEGQGSPVGLFEDTNYSEIKIDLPSRFRMLMFSDGIL